MLLPLLALVPAWRSAAGHAMRQDEVSPALEAERWVEQNVHPRARLLVDDTLYVDLVRAGFEPRFGVVWFYKLDFTTNLDPSVARNLPGGWRTFDYVVSTPVIRSALRQNPNGLEQVRRALRNSTPVTTFGYGMRRVEVRRITGIGTGSGRIPPAGAQPGSQEEKESVPPSPPFPYTSGSNAPLHEPEGAGRGRPARSEQGSAQGRPSARSGARPPAASKTPRSDRERARR
jgi:hypothetical protein